MKKSCLLLLALLGASHSHAATVHAFWSFQDTQSPVGSAGAFQEAVTAETFPGTPTLTRTGTAFNTAGGAASFEAFDSTVWTGSGGAGTPGYSNGYHPGTNNTFTITLDMTGLENLTLRMDIRSAVNSGATRVLAFTAIDYNIGSGFLTAAEGASLTFGVSGNTFVAYNLNLSALSAIEDVSSVQLRFTIPNIEQNASVRFDNLQLSASEIVPEPTAISLAGLALGCAALRRKRR